MDVTIGDDTITFRDSFDFIQGATIESAIALIEETDEEIRPPLVLATLAKFYILMGVESWTFRDEKGRPLAVTTANIRARILEQPEVRGLLREPVDELYGPQVLLPLVQRAASSSRPSQTEPSTSRTRRGGRATSPKPSKPSSISTIPTDGTEMTSSSLDGDSSVLQNSVSAA